MTNSNNSNELAVYTKLRGEFSEEQASIQIEALKDIFVTRHKVDQIEEEFKRHISNVENKLDSRINTEKANLQTDIEKSKSSILVWFLGVVLTSLITVLIKVFIK